MKALVLAGGYATRLRPITYVIPKLLFPLVGRPIIYWTLDKLEGFQVNEVVFAVNYLANSLRATVGDRYHGVRVRYSLEDSPLGTGGPIKLAAQTIRLDDPFIVMNGDIIADIDLERMLMHHQQTEALVTDALYEVKDPSRFGSAQLDETGRITRFIEKPSRGQALSYLVNAGIYLIEPEVLKMIPSKRRVSLEREIFPILAKERKLAGFRFSGHWFDIGSIADYREANFALLEKCNENCLRPHRHVARNVIVEPPVYLGKRVVIEANATIGPRFLLGNNGTVKRLARVSESILFDDVTVGERSQVSGCVIGSKVNIGRDVKIGSGSIISPNVQISDNVRIGKNTIIHPYKEINVNVESGANIM
jgi:mannose-1-phosphate guanylyltransferase